MCNKLTSTSGHPATSVLRVRLGVNRGLPSFHHLPCAGTLTVQCVFDSVAAPCSALPPTIPLGSVHLSHQSPGRALMSPLSSCSGEKTFTAVHKRTLYCDAVTTKRQLEIKISTGHDQHSNVFNMMPVDGQVKVGQIAHF